MNNGSVLIVIPTYNERENIEELLNTVFNLKAGYHVLVVDDNSPDGTAHRVLRLQKLYADQLFVLLRPCKSGLGRAYVDGFFWALKRNYDYICSMDADFSHEPADIARLLSTCVYGQSDMVIGSRYVLGSRLMHWPFKRILYSKIANYLTRIVMGLPMKDVTAGFVCYRCALLKNLDLDHIVSSGYSFQIEMKFLAYRHGAQMMEIPITFRNRVKGKSKMYIKDALKGFWHLLLVRWRTRKI